MGVFVYLFVGLSVRFFSKSNEQIFMKCFIGLWSDHRKKYNADNILCIKQSFSEKTLGRYLCSTSASFHRHSASLSDKTSDFLESSSNVLYPTLLFVPFFFHFDCPLHGFMLWQIIQTKPEYFTSQRFLLPLVFHPWIGLPFHLNL